MSEQIALNDPLEAMEHFFMMGWTDGLPVVPPTPEKVEAMLKEVGLTGSEIMGKIAERNSVITSEKVAINAVMAGCLPAYMPVVLAAVQAVLDPAFGVHGPTVSTGGAATLVIVNGPIIQQIGLNSGKNLMGTGHRANLTIGRAVRFVLQIAGAGAKFDQTTIGHPGKISFCIAEAEREDWEPLHVQRGFQRTDSTVTVFASEGPNQIYNHVGKNPEQLLLSFADRMTPFSTFNMQRNTQCVVVVCPEHLATIQKYGWDKTRVQQFLFDHARRPRADLEKFGFPVDSALGDKDWITVAPSPEDILLVAGGGPAGSFSSYIPGWASKDQSIAITKPISAADCGDT